MAEKEKRASLDKSTSFLGQAARGFETAVGDVGEWTPLPMEPVTPPTLGEELIKKEDVDPSEEALIAPPLEKMKVGQEFIKKAEETEPRTTGIGKWWTETVPEAIKKGFEVSPVLQKQLDDAKARGASKIELAKINTAYFLGKEQQRSATRKRLELDPILRKLPFSKEPYAIEGRPPLPDENFYNDYMALVEHRELSQKVAEKKARLRERYEVPHRIELGKTLLTTNRDYDENDPDKKYNWAYLSRSTELGVNPYYFRNMTWDQARNQATVINDYMEKTGSLFYTPAHKELNTKIRRLIQAGGDPYLWMKTIMDFAPVEWEERYQNLQERYGEEGKNAIGGDKTLRFLASLETVRSSIMERGLPNYFYGLIPYAAKGFDVLLNMTTIPLDNLFLDLFVENANILQNDEHARFSLGENVTLVNDNLFYNPAGERWESPEGGPIIDITRDELLHNMENAEARNVMTGAVRSFSENYALILSITAPQAPFAVAYAKGLAWKAAQNISKRKTLNLTKTGKGKWEHIRKDELFMEMKILHGQRIQAIEETSRKSFGRWLKQKYRGRQFYFATQPLSWAKDIAFMQFGADMSLELADRYLTSGLREGNTEWHENIPAAVIDIASFIAGGYMGIRFRHHPLQWPFRFTRWTAEGAAAGFKHAASAGAQSGVPILSHFGKLVEKGFDNFLLESRAGSLKLPGLNKTTVKRLEQLGASLIKLGDTHPEALKSMRDSWVGMQNLYYQMLVPRDNAYTPLVDQENFFKNQDKMIEYDPQATQIGPPTQDIIQWQQGKAFFSKEEAIFTIGQAYDIKVLQTLENSIAGAGQITDLKPDARFNFIKLSYEARKIGEDLQVGIQRNLEILSLIPSGQRTQEINALEVSLNKSLQYLNEEHAVFAKMVDRAVILQVTQLLGESDLSKESSNSLLEILNTYPSLQLKDVEEAKVLGVRKKLQTARNDSLLALGATQKFRTRLQRLNNYLPKEFEAYGASAAAVKRHGGSPARAIADFSQQTIAVTLGHVADNLRITYSGAFDEAIENIPANVGAIDVMDFMQEINIATRIGGPLQQLPMLQNYIEGISKTYLQPQVIMAYRELAKIAEVDKDTGRRPTWNMIRKEHLNAIAEARGEPFETIKGGITIFDEIAYIQDGNVLDTEFGFLVSYSLVNEIRKTVALSLRNLPNGDLLGGKKIREIRSTADGILKDFRGRLSDMGYHKEVDLLERAHAEYSPNYRQRLIQSPLLNKIATTEKLRQNIADDKVNKDGKVFLEFTDRRTNLPMPVVWYGGKHPGGRVFDKDINKTVDNWFKDSSPKDIWDEIKVIFGEPKKVTVGGKTQIVFQTPKKGDPLWQSYKAFVKYLDNYLSARFASQVDDMQARETTSFADKVHKAKTEADWDWIFKHVNENHFVGEVDSPVIRDLAEKVRQLNRLSENTVGTMGKDWHHTLIAWTGSDNAARNATNDMLKKQTIWMGDRLAESAKIVEQAKGVLATVKQNTLEWKRLNNSSDLVQRAIETQVVKDGKVVVPFIEASRKAFLTQNLGTEEDFNKIIAAHFSQGIKDLHTVESKHIVWDMPQEYSGDYRGGIFEPTKPSRQTDLGYRSSEKEPTGYGKKLNWVQRKAYKAVHGKPPISEKQINPYTGKVDELGPPLKSELAVNGVELYNALLNNEGLFKAYMNKNVKLLNVIAKISTIRQQPATGEKLRQLTAGLPKLDLPNIQSRGYAIASKRASYHYPLTELAVVFMKNREAKSITQLLLAGPEVLEPIAKIMLTGQTNRYKVHPAWGEYLLGNGIAMESELMKAWIDSDEKKDDLSSQIDTLLTFHSGEYSPENLFPFGTDSFRDSKWGTPILTKKGWEVLNQRDQYIKTVTDNFINLLEDDEKLTLQGEFKKALELSQQR